MSAPVLASPLRTPSPFLPAAIVAATLAGCSSDRPTAQDDGAAPAPKTFVQDREADPSGRTVVITYSEPVTAASAETTAYYVFSGATPAQVTAASLDARRTSVTLTLDAPAIPGVHTISVEAGITDDFGTTSAPAIAQPLTSTDTSAPVASTIGGATLPGPSNDVITVTFDDDMIESEVTRTSNWNVESPLGTPFDVTGASIEYDAQTRTATVTLGAGAADQDLHTFDEIHASFSSMRDIAGNTIAATILGSGAVSAVVTGDVTAPRLLSAAPGAGNTVVLTFDEPVTEVSTADLQSGANPTGTEIELDPSVPAAPATGSFMVSAADPSFMEQASLQISDGMDVETFEFDAVIGFVDIRFNPLDGQTLTMGDGTTSVTFEFDSGGGVTGGNASVTLGGTREETLDNLDGAVVASALDFLQFVDGNLRSVWLNLNVSAGAAANVPITESAANFDKFGFSGGGVSPGAVPVPAGADSSDSAARLSAAIIASSVDVTPAIIGAGSYSLTNDLPGTSGNVAIIEPSDPANVLAFTGMSGGVDGVGSAPEAPVLSTVDASGRHVTATFTTTPVVGHTLRVFGVRDHARNQVLPATAHPLVAADASEPALDLGLSTAATFAGPNNDVLTLDFDRPLHPDGATDLSNFALSDGAAVDLAGAEVSFDGDEVVTIDLGASVDLQDGTTYTLTASGLTSRQGVPMSMPSADTGVVAAGDNTAPGVTAARLHPSTPYAVVVEFSETVAPAGAALTTSYTLAGNATTAVSVLHPRGVVVTFTTQPNVAQMIDVSAAALTDLAGNAAAGTATVAITAADTTRPTASVTADNDTPDDRDEIRVTFDQNVVEALAVDPANYVVTHDGVLALTDASVAFEPESNTVVFTLPTSTPLRTGELLEVVVSSVTDTEGSVVQATPVTTTVNADAVSPSALIAFVDHKRDATGATVEVEFDEWMNEATTLEIANWSGSGGQAATSVTRITATRYRVTLDAALGAAETIDVASPTDRAGNVGATLQLDPIE